jgi:hypothetical protein
MNDYIPIIPYLQFHFIPYCCMHPETRNGDYLHICYPEIMLHINTDSSLHVHYAFTLNLTCPRRTVLRTFLDSIQQFTDELQRYLWFEGGHSDMLNPLDWWRVRSYFPR